jgi:hypothetical protein
LLDAAFGNWTSSISERGFDDAFLSLLRANGFHDVHFTHGAYEFGKDVIAKRLSANGVEQHAFQSKAGDIGGGDWGQIYSQMHELLGLTLTHPGFDPKLPQVRHLVTTGRLVGKAILSAREFRETAARQGVQFVVDDRDTLLEWLKGLPTTDLIASRSPGLELVIGRIAGGVVAESELEPLLAAMIPSATEQAANWRALLDISICARAFSARQRPLHGTATLLHGIRLGAIIAHRDKNLGREILEAAMRLYIESGRAMLSPFLTQPESPREWASAIGNGFGVIVGYPIATAHVIEFLGLAALFHADLQEPHAALEAAKLLGRIVRAQPGALRPISDRFAASTSVAIAALARFGQIEAAESLLLGTTNWLCDRYQDSESGLAGPYASPADEVRTLLMSHLEIELPRRRESLLAVALADLAHTFLPNRYEDVLNDILAVGIVPTALHAKDHPDAYFVDRTGQTLPLINVRYPETRDTPIAHFGLQSTARIPEQIGGPSVPLALAAIARDRLFSDVFPRLSTKNRAASE